MAAYKTHFADMGISYESIVAVFDTFHFHATYSFSNPFIQHQELCGHGAEFCSEIIHSSPYHAI
jgi:hypothetical protein